MSSNLTEIPNSAFSYCSALKSVNSPDGVRNIRQDAFAWCESLEEIYIPDSVNNISSKAFRMEDTSKITIIGNSNSYARSFASRYKINFKPADERQIKIMMIVMISVWSAVLVICLVMLIAAGLRKKGSSNGKENI